MTIERINPTDLNFDNSLGMTAMEVAEPDRRTSLASIDQNVQRTLVSECHNVSIKRGGKWIRLQRDKDESGESKKLETHENKVMTP